MESSPAKREQGVKKSGRRLRLTQVSSFILVVLQSRQQELFLRPLWAAESFDYFNNLLGAEAFLVSSMPASPAQQGPARTPGADLGCKAADWGSRWGGRRCSARQLQFVCSVCISVTKLCSVFQPALGALGVSLADKAEQ